MVQAKKGDTVRVHYTGRFDDGTVFDTSVEGEPLQFTIGVGQVIPGFDMAVIDMQSGESKEITIPSEHAYGDRNEELVAEISRERLPEDLDLEVGQQLQLSLADGDEAVVMIVDLSETTVTLDANHPLAGLHLTFKIELVEIV
jgi:peptidylprolyl isomerase